MIKNLWKFLNKIIRSIQFGFYYICLVLSKGFFFYFFALFYVLERIFKFKIFSSSKKFFYKRQDDPMSFLILVMIFFTFTFSYTYLFIDNNNIFHTDKDPLDTKPVISDLEGDSEKESDLLLNYSSMNIDNVDLNRLRSINNDVVAWLMVDETNINYPIVKTNDNDYYLNHNFNKILDVNGWTFMDYRNSNDVGDYNTIFYGHELVNNMAFGSLSKVFTESWLNNSNHYIYVLTDSGKSVYEVFSLYVIEPENYYLQTNFSDSSDFLEFLNTLKDRSEFNFDMEFDNNSKIITLSTCSDDNKNRRVVHAKLIN